MRESLPHAGGFPPSAAACFAVLLHAYAFKDKSGLASRRSFTSSNSTPLCPHLRECPAGWRSPIRNPSSSAPTSPYLVRRTTEVHRRAGLLCWLQSGPARSHQPRQRRSSISATSASSGPSRATCRWRSCGEASIRDGTIRVRCTRSTRTPS